MSPSAPTAKSHLTPNDVAQSISAELVAEQHRAVRETMHAHQ